MGQTLRPVEARAEARGQKGQEWGLGVEFLGRGSEPPSLHLGDRGSAVSSPVGSEVEPWKIWILEHFGTAEVTPERSDNVFFHTAAVCCITRRLQHYTWSLDVKG